MLVMILDYVVRFPALWAAFILLINDKINCNIKAKFDVCRWKLRKCHPTQLISEWLISTCFEPVQVQIKSKKILRIKKT